MSELSPDFRADRILAVIGGYLRDSGADTEGLTFVGEPWISARSKIYQVATCGGKNHYVVKIPFPDQPAGDGDPPLTAIAQFKALERACSLYADEDSHAVARPIAALHEIGALVVEYIPGVTVANAMQRGVFAPTKACRAAAAAGDALRRLHRRSQLRACEAALTELVDDIFAAEASSLRPLGLELPRKVRRVLEGVPSGRITARRVLLHGDYVGQNLILTRDDQVTMIDPLLASEGLPEDDVARFLAVLSTTPVFRSGMVIPPIRKLRQNIGGTFLAAYGDAAQPVIFELRLLRQHARRWRRYRELSRLARYPVLMSARARVIDHYMRGLLMESSQRLSRALSEAASDEGQSRYDPRETGGCEGSVRRRSTG